MQKDLLVLGEEQCSENSFLFSICSIQKVAVLAQTKLKPNIYRNGDQKIQNAKIWTDSELMYDG